MYHSRFKGTHYQAGFRYGSMLYNHGAILKEKHIFNLTEEKIKFGKECIKVCCKVYPEILEEMKGIADGQKMEFEKFASFIFGMYCFTLDNLCTCFAFQDDNNIVFGRNSDFITKLKKLYESCFYHLDNSYSFIGNTTSMVQIEDGVNEYGLAIGLTFIYPALIRPGLNAGLLVRYILERCKTVKEALAALQILPIASNQTLTMIDKTGDMLVVECNNECIVEIRPDRNKRFVATANNFNSPQMEKYKNPEGNDLRSSERYQVAYETLNKAEYYSVELAKDLLAGKYGFMCQYEHKNLYDTVWSSIFDLKNNKIYRVEGNPSRKRFIEDIRLKFNKSIL